MFAIQQTDHRFHLEMRSPNPAVDGMFRLVTPGIERLLAFDGLSRISAEAAAITDGDSAENRILRILDARALVDEDDLRNIPASGPCIVVANHPFGGVEGLLLASLLKRRRTDVKIMANFLLGRIGQLRDLFILVDPFGGENAAQANRRGMQETLRWLASGGVLGVFPAGEVSHFDPMRGEISDPAWSATIGRLAQRSGVPVVPVHFSGHNGALFHTLGMLHPRLRTVRLPHEFVNKRGLRTEVRIGTPVPPERIARFKTAGDVAAYLRIRTYMQGTQKETAFLPPSPGEMQAIVPATKADILRNEIASLPADTLLLTHEQYRVHVATAPQIPVTMREIGRLREVTFRAANEGTGREIDLDCFDEDYLHLFLWNEETAEVVAAYRLGQSDVLLSRRGKHGLYTRTLFNIRRRLLKQISPALEMGRSFVRPEYQRQFLPLMLLWRGIGTYVSRNPRYRNLFGPVSIDSSYSSTSQRLLMDFLRQNNMDGRARLVRPKTPPSARRIPGFDPKAMSTVVRDLGDLSGLIADIENDRRDIPILLRQYLKLGGVLLGFNVDPDFSNVLDGLILVDLVKTDRALLERYMGRDGAARFLAHHA